MNLEKLKGKYDISKSHDVIDRGPNGRESILKSWQDSAAVVRLSLYLKKHKNKGMTLYRKSEHEFALSLNPGLYRHEFARWSAVHNAYILMIDAADDLYYLMKNNLIDIATGPSKEHELQGSQKFR